jgi:hypothetical protein
LIDDIRSSRSAPSAQGLSFLYFLGWAVLLGARQWAFSASLFFSGMVCEWVTELWKLERRIPLGWVKSIHSRRGCSTGPDDMYNKDISHFQVHPGPCDVWGAHLRFSAVISCSLPTSWLQISSPFPHLDMMWLSVRLHARWFRRENKSWLLSTCFGQAMLVT